MPDIHPNALPDISALGGTIADANVSNSANIAWSKISKTGSSLADLATRTTANLTDFPSQSGNADKVLKTDGTSTLSWGYPEGCFVIACSDETTSLTTGTAKVTFRAPFAFTIKRIPKATLSAVSTSGLPEVNIKVAGTTIFGTKLTIDANEKTSTTAAAAATLATSTISVSDDAEITIDIDTAGTGAKGLKVYLYYVRS